MIDFITAAYNKLSLANLEVAFYILKILICLFSGILITLVHSLYSYNWLRNKFNIYVGTMLPVIGLTITTAIGSNIALSLGMIGALSIVRFRTPIRSPYELIHYFSLLTIGIVAKVDITMTIVFVSIACFLPFFYKYSYKIFNFEKNYVTERKQIHLNFEGEIEFDELKNLDSDKNIINYNIDKNNNGKLYVKAFAIFDNNELKNKFVNNWKKNFKSLEISKNNYSEEDI